MSDLLPKLSPLFTSCVALRDSGVLGAMKQRAFWRRVPEGNLVKPQPFYRLCKLAKGSAREDGDVRAHFTHARYAFSQKAMHKTNNKQPCLSVCAFDCNEIIKASKCRFAAALLWSAKMQGFNAASPSCLLSCLHPWYAVIMPTIDLTFSVVCVHANLCRHNKRPFFSLQPLVLLIL